MILRRTKGGISRNREPKLKTLEGFVGGRGGWGGCVGGALKFAWKMKSSRKSSNVISGDHLSEVTFKGGIG